MTGFYIYANKETYGPVEKSVLKEWIREQRITHQDYIWDASNEKWILVIEHPEIKDYFNEWKSNNSDEINNIDTILNQAEERYLAKLNCLCKSGQESVPAEIGDFICAGCFKILCPKCANYKDELYFCDECINKNVKPDIKRIPDAQSMKNNLTLIKKNPLIAAGLILIILFFLFIFLKNAFTLDEEKLTKAYYYQAIRAANSGRVLKSAEIERAKEYFIISRNAYKKLITKETGFIQIIKYRIFYNYVDMSIEAGKIADALYTIKDEQEKKQVLSKSKYYFLLGKLYTEKKEFGRALDYFFDVTGVKGNRKSYDFLPGKSAIPINLNELNFYIGYCYEGLKEDKDALKYYKRVQKSFLELLNRRHSAKKETFYNRAKERIKKLEGEGV